METSLQKVVYRFREAKNKHLSKVGPFFLKLKISANMMTTLALLLGLSAIYFLFNNYILFIIFTILHLLADGTDGLIARASQPTKFGEYFDLLSDRSITFFIFIKIAIYLQDYYVLVILALFTITHSIYFLSKMEYPVVFTRTGTVLALFLYPLGPIFIPTGIYLVVGGFIIYSLISQLRYFLRKNHSKI
jgi:phosphatidylglycerophosphate synthase